MSEDEKARLTYWANRVKARDGYQCAICGSPYRIEAHHIIPRSHDPERRWWYAMTNGLTVCRDCHRRIHGDWMNRYKRDYEH